MTEYLLSDLLKIKNGRDHKHLEDGEIPVYGSGGIMRYANESLYDEESILLPRKGTLNNIQYTNKPFWTVDTIYYTEVNKDKVDAYYLYHYLKLLDLSNLNSGTGVPSMTFGAYYGIKINLPELQVQKQIAKVLSDLDAKIEVNNKINQELEAMAKTIYDYWFVQFDFPSVTSSGVEKPYKSSGGKMVYNEELKREIPEGWEVKELCEIVDKIIDHRGKTPKKLGGDWEENGKGIIALSAKIVKEGKLRQLEKANRVSYELYDKWMQDKLKDGDVLVTSEAPAGECYFIYGLTEYCLSQRLFAIRVIDSIIKPSFFYFDISRGYSNAQIFQGLSGSTVFGIRQDVLRRINVLIPNYEIQQIFDRMVLPYLRRIKLIEQENQKLTELRDWLLPMLMNGQVRVVHSDDKRNLGEAKDQLGRVAEEGGNYGN